MRHTQGHERDNRGRFNGTSGAGAAVEEAPGAAEAVADRDGRPGTMQLKYASPIVPTEGVLKTMLIKKAQTAVMILLMGSMIVLGTTASTYRTLASDQGRATNAAGDRALDGLPPITHVIHDESRLPPDAARLYAYVSKPLWPAELAYREIPWLVDLNQGLQVARDEKRPLLLWTSGDDPLDRC